MPRIKPPPAKEPVLMEDNTPPQDSIVIELPDDDAHLPVEVDLAPPEKKKAPEPEDNPLQKALEAQQRAEELARTAQRERDEALRQAQQREGEVVRERGEREDAQYNSVLTAIAAEQSALDKAEADHAAFMAAGDWANAAKAQRLIATAAARIERLDEGKSSFEQRREAVKTAPKEQPKSDDFETRISKLPGEAKEWLRKHPEFINDAAMNRKIQAAHGAIVDLDGVAPFSSAYFDALDTRFGFKNEPGQQTQPQTQRRSMPVSAPVSRDVPNASGVRQPSRSVTLSPEERLIARTSFSATDMSNEQKEALYAKNKQKLAAMKANGTYRLTTEEHG